MTIDWNMPVEIVWMSDGHTTDAEIINHKEDGGILVKSNVYTRDSYFVFDLRGHLLLSLISMTLNGHAQLRNKKSCHCSQCMRYDKIKRCKKIFIMKVRK